MNIASGSSPRQPLSQPLIPLPPPALPADSVYTSCYCEENVYLLAQALSTDPRVVERRDVYVVFVSNENKTVSTGLGLGSVN